MFGFAEEIGALVSQVLETFRAEQKGNLVSFAMFGSLARGEGHPGSDVDLLIVMRELPPRRFDRSRLFWNVVEGVRRERGTMMAAGWPVEWSPILLTVEEARHHSPIYLDMVGEARILFDEGSFFAGVLNGLRARMRELGTRRVRLPSGGWYWDLKPDRKPGEVIEL